MAAAVPLLPYIAIGLTAAGTAVTAYSAYESGRQQRIASEYNARLAEQQAGLATEAAKQREEDYRKAAKARLSEMRTKWAKAGVSMEGTPLLVQMESAREVEENALRIRYGGVVESSAYMGEAGLRRMMGEQAYQAGIIGAGASLLSGAGKATWMYATYKSK